MLQKDTINVKGNVEILWEPPGNQVETGECNNVVKAVRVAAYCRVSTNLDEQTDSFEISAFATCDSKLCKQIGYSNVFNGIKIATCDQTKSI